MQIFPEGIEGVLNDDGDIVSFVETPGAFHAFSEAYS